ncbi:hypothetical protein HF1_11160 [Mycoplasma haemofelis str. Langford 1]|uniref:Uncharacterized protein n=1 Tax=Mycoplasma haemofelis (strain Langford 1) TaxID=941640 RepID=E8ZJ03_MYCHL|nr:hypothetical protein [Mycoplasma haemofelis]CBY93124.1 hypothetical protein HF1_11160 [Mycoplasma haemofelis str. Langford 1]
MTGLSKGLAGAAGAASGTGALVFGIYKLSSSEELKTISSLLDSKKRKLIKSNDGSEESWKSAWQKYRSDFNSSDKNPFSLTWSKGTSSVSSENATQAFMEACEVQGSKKVKDIESEDYQLFFKYCTRNTLMSDLVVENPSRKALVKVANETEDSKWVAVWEDYKKVNKDKANQADHWKLSDWPNKSSENKVPVSFMTQCETELKREYFDVEGDDYKKVISWCTESVSP